MIFRLASPEKRHNNEKPPLEEEKKEKIEMKSITSDGETNTATKVKRDVQNKSLKELFYEAKKVSSENKCKPLPPQLNMDEYCGDDSEEKNPYPANDYIGKPDVCNARRNDDEE